MVDGGSYVGGIAGYINSLSEVSRSINTNRINFRGAISAGAIVGLNNGGFIDTCIYDEQVSGVGDADTNSFGRSTDSMLCDGGNLDSILGFSP